MIFSACGAPVKVDLLLDQCLMLLQGPCHERPRTCRDYDCTVFAAAGIDAGGPEKTVINQRVRQWRFSYATEQDKRAHDAILAAARFIQERRPSFPIRVPTSPMGVAVLAIKVYPVFLDSAIYARPDSEIASAVVEASRRFDADATLGKLQATAASS